MTMGRWQGRQEGTVALGSQEHSHMGEREWEGGAGVRKEIKFGIKSGGLSPNLDSVTRSCGTEERKWALESLPSSSPSRNTHFGSLRARPCTVCGDAGVRPDPSP